MKKPVFTIIMLLIIIIFKFNTSYISEYIFVTSFYIGKSKHSIDEYKVWINSFSNIVKNNLFIFCNKEGYKLLSPNIKKFVKVINDVFNLEKIEYYEEKYKEMWKIDPESKIHDYRLYGIWNGKISMLKYVCEHVNSKLYIWIDIGSNRENKTYTIFPSLNRIKYLQNITYDSSMFFFLLYNFQRINKNKFVLLNSNYIEGTSFGGSKSGIIKYFKVYFSLHDRFYNKSYFVGKDQTLYNTIAYYNLSKVVLLKYTSNSCNNNIWFRFYDFYANSKCASVIIYKYY